MSRPDGYTDVDLARRSGRPGGSDGDMPRTAVARDRARVLHSAALRRLAGKTQVVGVGADAFPRTRLTHTLETAQVGRELGAALGCDPDLVDAACLAHDLGHPPFGHNGEAALDAAAAAIGGFEGNAQSLRLLVRLETKVISDDGEPLGLDLTRSTLDAATKYPWPRDAAMQTQPRDAAIETQPRDAAIETQPRDAAIETQPGRAGTVKFGVYADDLAAFDWLREGAPVCSRPFESQVMYLADDVAYCVHDIEDGIHSGAIVATALTDPADRAVLVELALAGGWCTGDAATLAAELDLMLAEPVWPGGFDGSTRGTVALKAWTSATIADLCGRAVRATRRVYGPDPLRRYAGDVVVPETARARAGLLKALVARDVMAQPAAMARQERERALLVELVQALTTRPDQLWPPLAGSWRSAPDDAARLRVVVDQVASLTDAAAHAWHACLRT